MKGKVYVLEDDTSISGLIKVSLEMNGIFVAVYSTVNDILSALSESAPNVALLDIMLPDGSGLDVLKIIKEKYPQTSCLMLSALGKEEDKVNGLNLGADDYITKPFSVLEMVARVNAALRRTGGEQTKLAYGSLILDSETMTVTLNGEVLELNRKEFELLHFFMKNVGKALSREAILTEVWGYEQGETRTLDNHVSRLRKLGIKNLETVFGVGYRFA